jgi:hypothetical protein
LLGERSAGTGGVESGTLRIVEFGWMALVSAGEISFGGDRMDTTAKITPHASHINRHPQHELFGFDKVPPQKR